MNNYTINKTVVSPIDVTASQVAPVTTIASTTTAQESVLGKRIRRQSSKYEDYEQHSITVRVVKCLFVSLFFPVGMNGVFSKFF